MADGLGSAAGDDSELPFGRTIGTADNGRRNTIQAFVVCTEFAELVSQLYPGTRPFCPPDGGGGPCPGSGGGYGQLCP